MQKKAVIFDMDGLLIDSEPLWRIAETRAMNAIGVPMVEEDGFLTMGLRTDEVVEWTQQSYGTGNEALFVDDLLQQFASSSPVTATQHQGRARCFMRQRHRVGQTLVNHEFIRDTGHRISVQTIQTAEVRHLLRPDVLTGALSFTGFCTPLQLKVDALADWNLYRTHGLFHVEHS